MFSLMNFCLRHRRGSGKLNEIHETKGTAM
jgi:hypothetical protein